MKMKSLLLITIAALACTVSSMAQNVPSYIPTDGLVGWWPFNGNANDESGNGNNGTVNGATLTSDRSGVANKAYSFDGASNYIEIVDNATLDIPNISVSAWFWALDYGTVQQHRQGHILSKREPSGWGNSFQIALENTTTPTNGIWATYTIGSNGWVAYNSNVDLTIQNWIHVVYTHDNTTAKLFLNGTLVSSTAVNGGLASNNLPLWFGARPNAGANSAFFHGKLDDISIWNRALTPQEITALYTASPTNNNETANTTANVPGAISYQAVARDAQGAPLADTNVQVRFTLIADSLSGVEEYVETHTLSTNSLGLFTTAFGAGTPVSNTFDNINWSAGHKFLNVQIDTGNGLVDMGTQQLLSTPYSLYSAKAGEIKNPGLPVFSDNAAALGGGLVAGQMYRTATGDLKIVY